MLFNCSIKVPLASVSAVETSPTVSFPSVLTRNTIEHGDIGFSNCSILVVCIVHLIAGLDIPFC